MRRRAGMNGRAALAVVALALLLAGAAAARPLTVRLGVRFGAPPTPRQCVHLFGEQCVRPTDLARVYDLAPLFAAGLDGRGATIAIVDSFGSPTIRHDLHVFDRAFGLPDPSLRVIAPAGRIPRFRPRDGTMVGWAVEATLDVEYAHAMAPGARILLVETPVAETEGIAGFPAMMRAERYVIDHRLASVISQSFGATEQTFTSRRQLFSQRGAYLDAAAHGVSVLAGSGDTGTAGYSDSGFDFYPYRVNSWPSSDPLVTSVGGTRLYLDAKGDRRHPDEVWDSPFGPAASGGGLSRIFARPRFQDGVARMVGRHRGTPDVSLNAADGSPALIYTGFRSPGQPPGWWPAAGTSESVQLFGGIVAVAVGAAGHPLGPLNPALYRLAAEHAPGILDVSRGTNAVTVYVHRHRIRIPGYRARAGYDLSSGLGTVDGARLVAELTGRGS